jgi:hypothetical protein
MIDKVQWQQRDLILWSKGHAIGALLQDLDEYAAVRPEHHSPLGLTQHLRTALAIDAELQIWYQQLLQESPSPLYWPTTGNGQDEGGFSFVNLQLAHLLLDFWALRLIVSVTVTALSHQIPLPTLKLDWQSPAGSTDSDSEEMPSHARDVVTFIHQARAEYNACQQMELATNIMESLPFCMKDENGISSSQKCLFGARVALILLKRRQSEKLATYEALYDSLSADKGFSWAKGVESTESIRTWEKKI